MSTELEEVAARMKAEIKAVVERKRVRLRELELFILDNTLRESTVGQPRSHTIENKKQIFKEIKRCGMKNIIVACFAHMTRVDDDFVQWLKDEGEDFSQFFSFSEVTEGLKDGVYDTTTVPISLRKNKKFGLYNVVFEVDLADPDCAWGRKFTVDDMCQLILKWMKWVYDNINKKARLLINFRDLPFVMNMAPERLLKIVRFLAQLPPDLRMFGLTFEDPMGESLPEELEAWTRGIRGVMDTNGWSSGKLLVHIHQKWDLQTASQLDSLSAGADGIWASLCEEGAAMGHASSSVTLLNLIRLGNKKVLETYNCTEVRKAAIRVTELTTGKPPHPKQVVYGERAIDLVFALYGVGDFNLGDFFGEETVNRITTLATPEMIRDHLVNVFGENEQFTAEMGQKMKETIMGDLRATPPRKEEYQSPVGIALLFGRSGGKLTKKMSEVIHEVDVKEVHHKAIVKEIRNWWDMCGHTEDPQRQDCLQFDSFYYIFLAPYFGCYRCVDTKMGLKAMDMGEDGFVDWHEFMVYIKWALNEYPDLETADECLSVAFEKGLIPDMRDEKLKHSEALYQFRHAQCLAAAVASNTH